MRLLRLRVDSFGALKGEFSFDPDKVTVIVDQNERGKSTLLAAVGAALYGLDGDKRRWPVITPLERWRPWSGDNYKLELELESGGERYTVRRDLARGTVEVWNSHGQEISPQFLEGKDEFPIGKKLLGIDSEEFEKCAFVRLTDLEHVVPPDEKARRGNTLQARLENAADTRGGDTNATEAVALLEGALKKYNDRELDFTGTIDNAIQRLEAKRGLLETEAKNLEHELEQVAGPLEQLSALGEEENQARLSMARVSDERKGALAAEFKAKLEEDSERRAELERLEAEARELVADTHVPENSEADLNQTVGQLEQAQRNLEALEARHRDEQARERSMLEVELDKYKTVESSAGSDADRLIALAAEMRRIADEDGRRRAEISDMREQLAGKGVDQERLRTLRKRFDGLDDANLHLLRNQSELGLVYQSDLAGLESQRTEGTEAMREIDTQRSGLRVPGWLLVALGFGAGIAGGALVALGAEQRLWAALLSGGSILIFIGVLLLMAASGLRRRERIDGLEKNWAWVGDEKRSSSAEVAGHKDKALRILQAAGLVYDPEKPWSEHARELAERVRGKARHRLLMEELIPAAQRRVMPEAQRNDLAAQLLAFEAETGAGKGGASRARTPIDLERESRRLQERLEEIQKQRGELKARVDAACRRYEADHPEKLQQIERFDRALARARRFKRSIETAITAISELALDTHKRWSEFLNRRVAELLEQVGARVEELRFGEDLDFSVKLWNGQQFARGKAVSQMSTGARDQLYLAIRLAISEYLSSAENPLPLLIDDVFATSDDDRARAGMRLLIEHFGEHHQIVIVSCHRHRLETLSRLDPELYKTRVQWLDARTTSFAR